MTMPGATAKPLAVDVPTLLGVTLTAEPLEVLNDEEDDTVAEPLPLEVAAAPLDTTVCAVTVEVAARRARRMI